MTDFPGEHPEPPGDLETSEPLLAELSMGAIISRLHARGKNPLFFGRTRGNRFDSPDRSYGVLYAGLDEYCSFIETYGQTTGIRTVTATALEGRHLAHLELLHPMKLIDLSSSGGLARIGADSRRIPVGRRCNTPDLTDPYTPSLPRIDSISDRG